MNACLNPDCRDMPREFIQVAETRNRDKVAQRLVHGGRRVTEIVKETWQPYQNGRLPGVYCAHCGLNLNYTDDELLYFELEDEPVLLNKLTPKPTDLELSQVLLNIKEKYGSVLLNQAVAIFTPLPKRVPLGRLNLSDQAFDFIQQYEPRAKAEGLFEHQFNLLDAYCRGAENFILTSATGSGKSLCFWTWVIDHLARNPKATALVCFPTQALMWGQADRLARASEKSSLKVYNTQSGNAYSGRLHLGQQRIGWTVWKGVGSEQTRDEEMAQHEQTSEFSKARIRLATLDKAHWSLISSHVEFTENLNCIVLDEAHQYDGIFGANVLYFLKRLYVAKETARQRKPNIFLASATLSDAQDFAAKLVSLKRDEIYHQADAVTPEPCSISLEEAITRLKNPPSNGLLRIAVFVDSLEKNHDLAALLDEQTVIGDQVNILYFSDSKFRSRTLKRELDTNQANSRVAEIYDSDLPPSERRRVEAQFNQGAVKGGTLIGTNALELGVDIDNLDLCLLNTVPPKRVDFIQRIGRVGRRQQRPGLVLINLGVAPLDRWIARNLADAFRFDISRTIPIPSHLEMLRLRHMAAAHYEGCYRNYANGDWSHYQQIVKRHFGEFLDNDQVKAYLKQNYGELLDVSGNQWVHKGFRASASEAKIPLRVVGSQREDIAWIEDINIFRDAHPEAVYLDAKGRRWRVIAYDGKWREAEWRHPNSKFVLAKYLKSIDIVYVEEVKELLTTRGMWAQSMTPNQTLELPKGAQSPTNGSLEYGIWEYMKKFTGYKEISLSTHKSRQISIAEVSRRFRNAIDAKEAFPFLFPLSYRTYGWVWGCHAAFSGLSSQHLAEIEWLVGCILEPYLADAVQANPADLQMSLSLTNGQLQVLDALPGGNGLSEALLRDGCLSTALSACLIDLKEYTEAGKADRFKSYILQLCREEATHDASQIITIIERLQSYWG